MEKYKEVATGTNRRGSVELARIGRIGLQLGVLNSRVV